MQALAGGVEQRLASPSWRSRKPVSVSPAAKAGWRSTRTRKSRLWTRPGTLAAASALGQDRRRLGAARRPGDDLGEHRVVVRARPRCRPRPRSRPGPPRPGCPGPASRREPLRGSRSRRAGRSAAGSHGPDPRRRGAPRSRGRVGSSPPRPSGSVPPQATSSCRRTRSRPVTISVTGCSTCRRVFISRKKNSPSAPSRNSTVPAPT